MLIVDDNETFRERLAAAIRQRGIEVWTACDFATGLALAKERQPSMVVVDLKMPQRSGLELVRDIRLMNAAAKIVVLTGFGSIATAVEAIRMGAWQFLQKPANADEILAAFADAKETEQGSESAEAVEHTPSLARMEWEYIHRVLADCNGNVSEAARRLQIPRRSLQRKLRRISPE